jgi:hypothetical protein
MRLWSVKRGRTSCRGKGNMPKMSLLSVMLVSFVSFIVCTRIDDFPCPRKRNMKDSRRKVIAFVVYCEQHYRIWPIMKSIEGLGRGQRCRMRRYLTWLDLCSSTASIHDFHNTPCHSILQVPSEDIQDQPSRCLLVQCPQRLLTRLSQGPQYQPQLMAAPESQGNPT